MVDRSRHKWWTSWKAAGNLASFVFLVYTVPLGLLAADFVLDISGYYAFDMEYSPQKEDDDKVTSFHSYGIWFAPKFELDNGTRISGRVSLSGEGSTSSSLNIRNKFGTLALGEISTARSYLHVGAPYVPGGIHSSLNVTGAKRGDWGTLTSTNTGLTSTSSDGRISYYTPRWEGAKFGLTYSRDEGDGNEQTNIKDQPNSDTFDFGANYLGYAEIMDTDYDVSFGYGTTFGDYEGSKRIQILSTGATFYYGNWTLGGSYASRKTGDLIDDEYVVNGWTNWKDGKSWEVGIAYDMLPWVFSFRYFHGKDVDDETVFEDIDRCRNPNLGGIRSLCVSSSDGSMGRDETLQVFELGATYEAFQGIDTSVFASYGIFDEETPETSEDIIFGDHFSVDGQEIQGIVVGASINFNF